MEGIITPKISKVFEKENNTAVFEIKPCYPGYGLTLGNSLRRVLISSLPGAAITNIRIKGAAHEFSTIQGILEDIVQITLNLKQVRIKMSGEQKVSACLKVSGEREVKAGDIEVPANVEIINKDLHIATITDKKTELEMAITIESGIGYVPSEKVEDAELPIGTIVLDAIFSPVVKANYSIDDIRVGRMTNYNQINLEIQTDGTISPQDSLQYALEILIRQFNSIAGKEISELLPENNNSEIKEPEETDLDASNPETLKILELGLPKRIAAVLEENKIKTVNKLANKSKKDISCLPGLGAKGMEEIVKALGDLGLSLKE